MSIDIVEREDAQEFDISNLEKKGISEFEYGEMLQKNGVVIVDDNPMILNTLDEVISSEAGLSVIGRADNGKDAIDMIKDTQPDVVLLDLVMPQMDGITVVEILKRKHLC